MNTATYNTEKPKVLARFYGNIAKMLDSGMPAMINEARRMLRYDTPNLDACSNVIERMYLPAIAERDANRKKFADFMEKEFGANWKKELKKQTPVM